MIQISIPIWLLLVPVCLLFAAIVGFLGYLTFYSWVVMLDIFTKTIGLYKLFVEFINERWKEKRGFRKSVS